MTDVRAKGARTAGGIPAIQAGMKVVGSDGGPIGRVARIWRAGCAESEGRTSAPACPTCGAYLMVARTPVFDPLYIPVEQVSAVHQGKVVLPVPADGIERQGWVGRRASLPVDWTRTTTARKRG